MTGVQGFIEGIRAGELRENESEGKSEIQQGGNREQGGTVPQFTPVKPPGMEPTPASSYGATKARIPAGRPWPLGVEWIEAEDAFNFALYSRHATGVTLLCYTEKDPATPIFEFRFQHPAHKTGSIWHCRIPAGELRGATLYAYRVEGPHDPERGQRFDPAKVLLDPYAPSVYFPQNFSREACAQPGPTDGRAPLGRLPKKEAMAVPSDKGPRYTCEDAVVYELHVKGFTARANSGVTPAKRGTFAGVTEKIPYLKDLGVTIVELLPVQQFDPQEGNYWGYMTLHFFSPHQQYAQGEAFDDSRAMVRVPRGGPRSGLMSFTTTPPGRPERADVASAALTMTAYHLLWTTCGNINDTGCGSTGPGILRGVLVLGLRFGRGIWAWTASASTWRPSFARRRWHDGLARRRWWRKSAARAPVPCPAVAEAWDISAINWAAAFPAWRGSNGTNFATTCVRSCAANRGRWAPHATALWKRRSFSRALRDTRRASGINFLTAQRLLPRPGR